MEVREVKDLIITLSKEDYQKYIVYMDEPSSYFDFKKFINHIQMFNIIDILDFEVHKNEDNVKINMKAVVK